MNALTPIPSPPSGQPTTPTTPALSPQLERLLNSEQSDEFAAGQIAGREELRGELIANLPVLKSAALAPAGVAGVMQTVGKRFAIYRQPERSEEEWAAFWSDYVDAVGHLSVAALEAGMQAWVNDPSSEFLPKPGKLRELAETTPNRAAKHYTRAQKVAQICRQPIGPNGYERPEPTEEERAKVRSMLASFQAQMAERTTAAKPRVELPSTAGAPDESGITPAMRQLLKRQRGEG